MNKALTPNQAAEILQVNVNTVYKMIKAGDLVAKKIGNKNFRISPTSLSWITTGMDHDIYLKEKRDRVSISEIEDTIKEVRKEA